MKGVIYNQEKPYLGVENGRRYWGGEAVNGGAVLGGQLYMSSCVLYHVFSSLFKIKVVLKLVSPGFQITQCNV